MGSYSAINCTNSSKNEISLFRVPVDESRRRKWIINTQGAGWTPGPGACLCSESKSVSSHKARIAFLELENEKLIIENKRLKMELNCRNKSVSFLLSEKIQISVRDQNVIHQ